MDSTVAKSPLLHPSIPQISITALRSISGLSVLSSASSWQISVRRAQIPRLRAPRERQMRRRRRGRPLLTFSMPRLEVVPLLPRWLPLLAIRLAVPQPPLSPPQSRIRPQLPHRCRAAPTIFNRLTVPWEVCLQLSCRVLARGRSVSMVIRS